MSGAAPLASHVEEFLRVTLCAMMVQGYGEVIGHVHTNTDM
jgi:long-subunit acyl-CoA synthetase (AMP-forming)